MTNPYRAMCAELADAAEQARQALEGWANYGQWVWPESALEQAKRNTTEALASLNRACALLAAASNGKRAPARAGGLRRAGAVLVVYPQGREHRTISLC